MEVPIMTRMPEFEDLTTTDTLLEIEDYRAAMHEITNEKRFPIVCELAKYGEMSASGIADQIGMDRGTCTHHLSQLVDENIVHNQRRKQREAGKPYSYYELTALGKRALKAFRSFIQFDQQKRSTHVQEPETRPDFQQQQNRFSLEYPQKGYFDRAALSGSSVRKVRRGERERVHTTLEEGGLSNPDPGLDRKGEQ